MDGLALGGGLEIALATDIRVAGTTDTQMMYRLIAMLRYYYVLSIG